MIDDQKIQYFISNLQRQFVDIDEIKSLFLRKIVLVSLLDSMSHAAFPEIQRDHRKRVIRFLDDCSGWADKDTISAQQLLLQLQKSEITNSKLFLFVQNHVIGWQKGLGKPVEPKQDLMDNQIPPIASEDEIKLINCVRYKELLYTYRNNLVHDFSKPGDGVEIFDRDYPYYHHMGMGDPWELVFPAPFFRKLCWDSISGLEKRLRDNAMNPYDSYEHGSTW